MEHVILLDEAGRARGRHDKLTVHTDATPLHLAFSCYVFDTAGRFLLTQRALSKRTWPGIWTNSVCGHPQEGESMRAAVARRASFELGLELDEIRLVLPAFRYRAELDGVVENEMCPVFYATAAAQPHPNPGEVAAVRWIPWDGFLSAVLADSPAYSPWSRLQARSLIALGPTPRDWPTGDEADLPLAALM
ncbi:isopentenyl-diphosphate delta-isomerase [Actinoplanes tereljensis]|uniref:Isopentenyl-diphosphate Delta-isomerase n=1 Tax=Paractinoplanes tereljensis TaxID=571912 RepID=A0A919TVG3_9ACTN|nr:isopentenyl-diphosphate Delta-isomerase [Actinoplanes tereljensis]GIF23916.1 isopentenyl-diphosphate Delta-isomerase [Actinoplanes tereljensis]